MIVGALVAALVAPPATAQEPPSQRLTPSTVMGADGAWTELFDGESLAGWSVTAFGGVGEVDVRDGRLRLGFGSPLTGVTWQGEVLRRDYEIEVVAARVAGYDFFCGLTFPVGDDCLTLVLGGWGGALCGISNLDGEDASTNATRCYRSFEQGQDATLLLRVAGGRVRAWLDGEPLVDAPVAGRRLGVRPEIALSQPLGIASYATDASIASVRVRRLPSERVPEELVEESFVDSVWSAHPVGFSLLTAGRQQFVAYYDAERRMTIASRALATPEAASEDVGSAWTRRRLDEQLGWDSHNGVTMALDGDGRLHVVGNLHVTPLVYFRSEPGAALHTLERVGAMVGDREERMTYPRFFRTPQDELVFSYRDGGSGDGEEILNLWSDELEAWERLLERPLLSGEGAVNGYFSPPALGPDGRFHVVGVWRDTPDCATNHTLSYARSADLVRWESAAGEPLALPLTPSRIDVVDPVPAGGGMINGNATLGFDTRQRPVIAYHKFAADGTTELFVARPENAGWRIAQVSDWGDYRWEFGGGGSIPFAVRVGRVAPAAADRLALPYSRPGDSGRLALDAETLAPAGRLAPRPPLPRAITAPRSEFPGMRVRRAADLGRAPDVDARYLLVWEALPPNRDRRREGPLPEPSRLRVVELVPARD